MQIKDAPEGWELAPDPEIAGENVARKTAPNGRVVTICLNEEGRPDVTVLVRDPSIGENGVLDGDPMNSLDTLDRGFLFADMLIKHMG